MESETIAIDALIPHPRNYREHPEDQLEHIIESIKRFGIYRNIIIAKDNTILAGHGVVLACKKLGLKTISATRLQLDKNDIAALKILTSDNEISHLGKTHDYQLCDLLKEIKELDVAGLLGTGYSAEMLANLVFVTKPENEISNFKAAAEWVGMPDYDEGNGVFRLVISFDNEAARDAFMHIAKINKATKMGATYSLRWPEEERNDRSSVKFETIKNQI